MQAEISYDLVMEDEMSFVEGTYRLPGRDWQVFIFSRKPEISCPEFTLTTWPSGIAGAFVKWPASTKLNTAAVKLILSEYLGVTEWRDVHGPDSMQLR